MEVSIDWDQANLVLDTLMAAYHANEPPYSRSDVMTPQDPRNLPKCFRNPETRDNQKYAMYLFFLCHYMRGGIKSTTAAKSLTKLYKLRPRLFDPAYAAGVQPWRLKRDLRSVGLSYNREQVSVFWPENCRRLNERFDGSPVRIFDGVTDFTEASARIMNDNKGGGFQGFQEKMTSMLIYYLLDAKLIDFFYYPSPIDFHVFRVLAANNTLRFEDVGADGNLRTEASLQVLRDLTEAYARKNELDPNFLCNALWLLSESNCSLYPGNSSAIVGKRQGRSTMIVAKPVSWSHGQLRAFNKSCRVCPLRGTCK